MPTQLTQRSVEVGSFMITTAPTTPITRNISWRLT